MARPVESSPKSAVTSKPNRLHAPTVITQVELELRPTAGTRTEMQMDARGAGIMGAYTMLHSMSIIGEKEGSRGR